MKRLTEYTGKELAEMTQEQTDRLIELECAFEGIQPAEDPGREPEKPAVESRTFFQVGLEENHSRTEVGLLFESMPDLDALWALGVMHIRNYERVGGDYRNVVRPVRRENLVVMQVAGSTEKQWDAVRHSVSEYDAAKRIWDTKNKAWQEYQKNRKAIVEALYEKASEYRDTEYRRADLTSHMNRYIDLANGDKEIAANFFKAAFPSAEDQALVGLELQ
jgi:hypothetical protein